MLISVVMAVHNGQKYLQEAIDSILAQTFAEYELIIVNDGSTDGTKEILQQISDERVKVIHLQKNRGAASALNLAIEHAKGKWIAIHDADDISCPTRLEKQVHYLNENPGTVAVSSFIECIHGRNSLAPQVNLHGLERLINRVQSSEQIKAELYQTCPLTHGTVIFDRNAFLASGRYDVNLRISYDYDLWTRLVTWGKIGKIPEKLYKYRVHGDSITRKNQILNINEMFFSCTKYIRHTCYDHLEVPAMVIFGPKALAEHLALQAEKNLKVAAIISENLRLNLPKTIRAFRQGKIDGAIILRNLRGKRGVSRYLIKEGMERNKNLFQFWVWFKYEEA